MRALTIIIYLGVTLTASAFSYLHGVNVGSTTIAELIAPTLLQCVQLLGG